MNLNIEDKPKPKVNLVELLENSQIKPEQKYNKPPVAMIINENYKTKDLLTLGNFSIIKGDEGTKKTMLASVIFSAFNNKKTKGNIYNLQALKTGLNIYIDTEQSDYHVWSVSKRISNLCNNNNSEFMIFALREFETSLRLEMIEQLFKNFGSKINYVVIDGIVDLIMDINNYSEATILRDKFMKITKENNCHISFIIHNNRSISKAMGHIGAIFEKKCETIFNLKDGANNYTTVENAKKRGAAKFKDFYIYFDEQHRLPVITDKIENEMF